MKRSVFLSCPSAFVPIAMSLVALSVVLVYVAVFGAAPEPDEGAAAHIWQLLVAGQLPIVAFFTIKWLPRTPSFARGVLAAQALAFLTALAPVYFFHL